MTHPSDEQFECALRVRLQRAFESIRPEASLFAKVRSRLELHVPPSRPGRFAPRTWFAMAAAAIIILCLIPAAYMLSPSTAVAAQSDLASLHEANLAGDAALLRADDPNQIAEQLNSSLGFSPPMPKLCNCSSLTGSCLRTFSNGKVVGAYVVKTPQGLISVAIVDDDPTAMKLKPLTLTDATGLWSGQHGRCRIVARQLRGRSYCAIGNVAHEALADIVMRATASDDEANQKRECYFCKCKAST